MPCFGSLTAPEIVFDIWDGQADAGTGRAAVWGGASGWVGGVNFVRGMPCLLKRKPVWSR